MNRGPRLHRSSRSQRAGFRRFGNGAGGGVVRRPGAAHRVSGPNRYAAGRSCERWGCPVAVKALQVYPVHLASQLIPRDLIARAAVAAVSAGARSGPNHWISSSRTVCTAPGPMAQLACCPGAATTRSGLANQRTPDKSCAPSERDRVRPVCRRKGQGLLLVAQVGDQHQSRRATTGVRRGRAARRARRAVDARKSAYARCVTAWCPAVSSVVVAIVAGRREAIGEQCQARGQRVVGSCRDLVVLAELGQFAADLRDLLGGLAGLTLAEIAGDLVESVVEVCGRVGISTCASSVDPAPSPKRATFQQPLAPPLR